MYAHGGSGNHGCEAIVRATADILEHSVLTLISSAPEEDRRYGLGELCTIINERSEKLNKASFSFFKAYAELKLKHDYVPMDKQWYLDAFNQIREEDIALSIGGDNYCYADVNKYVMLHDILKARRVKTALWGCSVEPEVAQRPEIAADLARYDLITARESITYAVLKEINSNTVLVADPAFSLKPQEIALPEGFIPGNTVGLNLSPMTMEREQIPSIAFDNYANLISFIIQYTDMQVALIPHVVWKSGDDRIPLLRLYDKFKETGRIILVPDHGCRELKYLISQCCFFIGARTHATIAAYSSCVPTLVVGYSVKARGIARDLFGTEDGYVLPIQELTKPDQLSEGFKNLYCRRSAIQQHLSDALPTYLSTTSKAKNAIKGLVQH